MMIISPHISVREYECPCCHRLPPSLVGGEIPTCYEWFFEDFEDIRLELGKPILISSGYRCPKHNKAIGGELLSAHLWGLALDLDRSSIAGVEELRLIVEVVHPELRMEVVKDIGTWIHIDIAWSIFPTASEAWRKGLRIYK